MIVCKSYSGDLRRFDRLLASVEKFNIDGLPFAVIAPDADRSVFVDTIAGRRCEFVSDESVVQAHPLAAELNLIARYRSLPGYLTQQVVKSEAWRLLDYDACLCVDSDTVFIRPFGRADLLQGDGHPHTVLCQDKDYFQLATNLGHPEVWEAFQADSLAVQNHFGRVGPCYCFGPFPVLWSTQVWQGLSADWLASRHMTLWDAIELLPHEAHWYGEYLLHSRVIPLSPIAPLCRCYHHAWQKSALDDQHESQATLAQQFIGVVYQSNWDEDLDVTPRRSSLSRLARRIKRLWRRH